ncbi:DUF2239 family protein [Bdellovibrio sp. HCB2-146]|uniref:DUF2239 family protein n=1 Tax=Bdellovibrio sp. HCB2-146 TaxID=3394362 RepID=UPI0039BCE442
MNPSPERTCTAFAGPKKIAHGHLLDVALKVKSHLQKDKNASILIFDDVTSAQVELDLRGTMEAVEKRMKEAFPDESEKPAGPGRPKLGVVSREISLLPRHWEWLALQPGGASVTIRKLIEEAKKKTQGRDEIRQAQDATYKFMTVMAGDLPHYEEALRAFYAKDGSLFKKLMGEWPKDVRDHVLKLSDAIL